MFNIGLINSETNYETFKSIKENFEVNARKIISNKLDNYVYENNIQFHNLTDFIREEYEEDLCKGIINNISLEEYAINIKGYDSICKGKYFGAYYNESGIFDNYSTGTNSTMAFLVKDTCKYYFHKYDNLYAPKGYIWVSGTLKKYIEWDKMKEYYINIIKLQFLQNQDDKYNNIVDDFEKGKMAQYKLEYYINQLDNYDKTNIQDYIKSCYPLKDFKYCLFNKPFYLLMSDHKFYDIQFYNDDTFENLWEEEIYNNLENANEYSILFQFIFHF